MSKALKFEEKGRYWAGYLILKRMARLRSSLTYLRRRKFFNSIDEFIQWVQLRKTAWAFDLAKPETPAVIYYQRLPKRKAKMDPSFLENIGGVK